jgi:hypothetical protein
VEYLTSLVHRTPLDILAEVLAEHAEPEVGRMVFDSYDAFLQHLDNDGTRKQLEQLAPEAAATDPAFQRAQSITRDFEQGLEKLFFDSKIVGPLTRTYGVF